MPDINPSEPIADAHIRLCYAARALQDTLCYESGIGKNRCVAAAIQQIREAEKQLIRFLEMELYEL